MNRAEIWIAILVAAGVSLLVRALPLTLIRRPIKNRFIRSFLYYVPYATLAVMRIRRPVSRPWPPEPPQRGSAPGFSPSR